MLTASVLVFTPPTTSKHPSPPWELLHSAQQRSAIIIMALNASFVSPTADAKVAHIITQFDTAGLLSTIFNGLTFWKAALALLVGAVVYDQCKCGRNALQNKFLTAMQSCTSGRRAPSSDLP